jgi:fatty-acid desaturase
MNPSVSPVEQTDRPDLITSIPFFLVHAAALGAVFVPFEPWYVALAIGLYYVRMFGVTAGYHRYFSHRAFRTSRAFQFVPGCRSWGFFVSTTLLWHGTFTINSLAHVFGSRRYPTTDNSRNNWLLSLITLGEGWHNNHHFYQPAANQGFFWWEFDPTYYALRMLSWLGLIRDLRTPPPHVLKGSLHRS